MKFIGRLIKYLLRSVFSIIIFLILVGLAKMNRDAVGYIRFLDANDRSIFHRSQPATWSDPFWPNSQTTGDIADILSNGTVTTGSLPSDSSWLDVFDPSFEQDLNAVADGSLSDSSGSGTDFWFVNPDKTTPVTQTWGETTPKDQILNVLQNSPNVQK